MRGGGIISLGELYSERKVFYMKKMRILSLVSIIVLFALLLTSCMDNEYTEQGEAYLEEFLDAVLDGDMDSAYDLLADGVVSESEFSNFYSNLRNKFGNTTDYSIECIGWNMKIDDGIETRVTTFLVETDDGVKLQFILTFMSGYDGLVGINCANVENEVRTPVNNVLTLFANGWLFSLTTLGIGLMIWMIVDCIKRPIRMKKPKLKFLYIILILICLGFSVTIGRNFGITSKFGLAIPYFRLTAADSLSFVCMFPAGAIIYFFIRNKLPLVSKDNTEAKPEENKDTEDQSSDEDEQ